VTEAEVDGLSGTVVATSNLGLPELPGGETGSAASLPGLLAGSTTARLWKAGDDQARIAVDASFAEFDGVRDGKDVWTYDSASSDVTHLVLPEAGPGQEQPEAPGTAASPQDAAEALLSMIEPSTEVPVGRAAMVADRAAYELVLRPKDAGTLIDTIRIAVDGETSMPLRVRVLSAGQVEPAVEIGFTSVSFAVPDASVFAFVPPPGSTVTERTLPDLHAEADALPDVERPDTSGTARPEVIGEGWSSIVVLSGIEVPEDAASMLDALTTPVEGGRVLTSTLLSVLLTDDGRVLAGAVPAESLVEAAAGS
jgi:outer membrane lipoprotein-sorting protein